MANVLIVGHSFPCRLKRNLTGSWMNLGFDRSDYNVSFAGRGGLTLPRLLLPAVTDTVKHLRPTIVLIQIGENELDNPTCERIASKLARDIVSFAQWLIEGFSVRQVAVLALFQRRRTRHVAVNLFNACVDRVNAELKTLCSANTGCFYWRHKGLKSGLPQSLCPDLVHLNRAGMRKYIYSVRGATLLAAKRVR